MRLKLTLSLLAAAVLATGCVSRETMAVRYRLEGEAKAAAAEVAAHYRAKDAAILAARAETEYNAMAADYTRLLDLAAADGDSYLAAQRAARLTAWYINRSAQTEAIFREQAAIDAEWHANLIALGEVSTALNTMADAEATVAQKAFADFVKYDLAKTAAPLIAAIKNRKKPEVIKQGEAEAGGSGSVGEHSDAAWTVDTNGDGIPDSN